MGIEPGHPVHYGSRLFEPFNQLFEPNERIIRTTRVEVSHRLNERSSTRTN